MVQKRRSAGSTTHHHEEPLSSATSRRSHRVTVFWLQGASTSHYSPRSYIIEFILHIIILHRSKLQAQVLLCLTIYWIRLSDAHMYFNMNENRDTSSAATSQKCGKLCFLWVNFRNRPLFSPRQRVRTRPSSRPDPPIIAAAGRFLHNSAYC